MTKVHSDNKKEFIILVDPDDQEIGEIEKIRAHEYGMLHRAFSVLIFRERQGALELLLQQRNKNKYHCGGLWTNTCCSHPHAGETVHTAAIKRLQEEMGIETPLMEIGKFHYIAPFDNGLTENEMDHVFIGFYDADTIPVNKQEVEDYKWVEVGKLKQDFAVNPSIYTPWFEEALDMSLAYLAKNK